MKKKNVFLLLSYFCMILECNAQNISNQVFILNKSKSDNSSTQLNKQVFRTGKTAKEKDYVLYRNVVRRYSWIEGLGEPITQETANHLPVYFKFSMKNKAGHWQLVEAMHGNQLTTNHDISTYVLDKSHDVSEANKEWREKLLLVGQWVLTSDLSGNNLIEERAYEAKEKGANLIYSFNLVQNDKNHVTASYNDSWGLPADMNENHSSVYGSVVYITYDANGCDSIIDYLDGNGYRKYNTNGVDQERKLYDNKMRLILHTSHNCVGDRMKDNWGNCGNKYEYDDKNNSYSITRVDENLEPMRMPAMRSTEERTFIRCDIKKDKYGRDSEFIMLTADGKPDMTLNGIHRIVYHYTETGEIRSKEYYAIDGTKISNH